MTQLDEPLLDKVRGETVVLKSKNYLLTRLVYTSRKIYWLGLERETGKVRKISLTREVRDSLKLLKTKQR